MVITEKISPNRRLNHIIFNDNPDPSTYASAILLREHYMDLDISFNEQDDWRYLFIVKRHWLRKQKKLHDGHWICHYCGKPIYKQAPRKKRIKMKDAKKCITVDHKDPQSKINDITDTSNFLESCWNCNHKKRDTPYEIFIKKFNHENQKTKKTTN